MTKSDKSKFAVHIDRNHLPEPEWSFPNAKIGTIQFGEHKQPTGMERLKMTTKMD